MTPCPNHVSPRILRFAARLCRISASVCLLLCCAARSASATPISFILPSFPDLSGVLTAVTYDANAGVFKECGYTDALTTVTLDSYSADSVPCDYYLQANIDSTGSFTAAGSFVTISGGFPFYSPPISDGSLLVAGNLTDFDFTPGGVTPTVFRFLVAVTQDPFNFGFGPLAGILTSANDIYVTGFAEGFSGTGRVDTFMQPLPEIPEPMTVVLVGSGIAAMASRRFRGQRSRSTTFRL